MSVRARVALDDLTVVREALADDYDVIEELGRGGMAVVFRARERALDRDVAIKVLLLRRFSDGELIERFQREARTSAQLEHPNIVPIYRVGRRDPVIFFVMKLLRGESLATRLDREGRLAAEDVRRLLVQTAEALGYAARRGIVHRDIKPDNIVFDDGRCVVTDFGIARSMFDARITESGMSLGTPRYMSPEQARARKTDGRSDIYSLGVVAYQCLVGRPPFDGEDPYAILVGHVESPLPRPRLESGEERDLFEVIERMLAKRPDDRFQNAETLIAILEAMPARRSGGLRRTPSAQLRSSVRAEQATTELEIPLTWPAPDAGDASEAESLPQPSPALDAALRAGIELLHQQRPRIEAGLSAGRRLIEEKMPGVRSGVARAIEVSARWLARCAALSAALLTRLAERARSRSRRFWLTTGVIVAAAVAARYAWRGALMHRSRCATLESGAGNDQVGGRRRAFVVLVDAIEAASAGADLDVYYDVCGLREGDAYTTRIAVVKNEFGFRRFFGRSAAPPITMTYDETAGGPAVRRHRTVRLDAMPAGSYTLGIVVTDGAGRRREKTVGFQLVER